MPLLAGSMFRNVLAGMTTSQLGEWHCNVDHKNVPVCTPLGVLRKTRLLEALGYLTSSYFLHVAEGPVLPHGPNKRTNLSPACFCKLFLKNVQLVLLNLQFYWITNTLIKLGRHWEAKTCELKGSATLSESGQDRFTLQKQMLDPASSETGRDGEGKGSHLKFCLLVKLHALNSSSLSNQLRKGGINFEELVQVLR